jgi:hypothetical protein
MSQEQRQNYDQARRLASQSKPPQGIARVPYPQLYLKVRQALSLCSGTAVTVSEIMSIVYVQTVNVDSFCKCSDSDVAQLQRVCEEFGVQPIEFLEFAKNSDRKPAKFAYREFLKPHAESLLHVTPQSDTATRLMAAAFSCCWGFALIPAFPLLVKETSANAALSRFRYFVKHSQVQLSTLIALVDGVKKSGDPITLDGWIDVFNALYSVDVARQATRAQSQTDAFRKLGVDYAVPGVKPNSSPNPGGTEKV